MAMVTDTIKQLADANVSDIAQPSENLLNAISQTQRSTSTLGDFVQSKGYSYNYDPKAQKHYVNDYEIPKELAGKLEGAYGTDDLYKQIIDNYSQAANTTQQDTYADAQQQAQTAATAEPGTPAAEGEYKSPYQQQIDDLMAQLQGMTPYQTPEELKTYLAQLLESASKPFTYDPTKDAALIEAQKEAGRVVREGMGAKGTLYSSATIANIARQQGILVPEYEMKQYQRYSDAKNREIQMMSTLMQWDEMQANRFQDQVDLVKTKFDYIMALDSQNFDRFQVMLEQKNFNKQYQLEQERLQMERQMMEIENAYKRVDALGYVDNQTSTILGIPVGTKAGWVKELELAQKQEMEKLKKEHDYQVDLQNKQAKIEKDLVKYKSTLDEAAKKKLMEQQYAYDKKLSEYQHSLEMGGKMDNSAGVIASAKALMGVKYVYGGTSTTKGMDCSAFTQYIMKQNGVSLPRTAAEQAKSGTYVDKKNLQAGDLVFFNTIDGNGKNVDHVGLYIGNGKMIHASSGQGKVVEVNMNTDYWNKRYTTARRFGTNAGSGGGVSSGGSVSTGGGSVGRNSSSLSTKQLQTYLKKLGYYKGSVDGKYGPMTTAAVKSFQKDMKIKVDGNFGPQSFEYLRKMPLAGL
jgi:cell wall-associated NlpC family hydrolase